VVKASTPAALAQDLLAQLLPDFLRRYPQVRLQLHVSNRRVDVINEGFDVALRVRSDLRDDGELVMRRFGDIRELLVASPKYLDRAGRPQLPEDLAGHTTLSMGEDEARQRWQLHGAGDEVRKVDIQPVLMAHDFPLLSAAARDGLGIALLPESTCADAVRRGELEVVLPEWHLPMGICHAVFASRRGLLPAVRVFIDFLAERLPGEIERVRLQCGDAAHCKKS
jgi:DNA-binding transcriptional LysR family regulator